MSEQEQRTRYHHPFNTPEYRRKIRPSDRGNLNITYVDATDWDRFYEFVSWHVANDMIPRCVDAEAWQKEKQLTWLHCAKTFLWETKECTRIYGGPELFEKHPKSGREVRLVHLSERQSAFFEDYHVIWLQDQPAPSYLSEDTSIVAKDKIEKLKASVKPDSAEFVDVAEEVREDILNHNNKKRKRAYME